MLPLYNGALPAFLYAGQTTKIEAGKRADAMTRARQKQENETSRSKFEHAQRSFIKLEVKVNA